MRTLVHSDGMTQKLAVVDLINGGASVLAALTNRNVDVVYSDPPWSPGNEKWWRRYADEKPPAAYDEFLDSWCRCVSLCNPRHVFVEQSVNSAHRGMFISAVARCDTFDIPLLEEWTAFYGSPKRPNMLLHFGYEKLKTNPGGMSGESMTRKVFDGLNLPDGSLVADPCTGLGMTSRIAHRHRLDFIGTELNTNRLDRTVAWLVSHGYVEES